MKTAFLIASVFGFAVVGASVLVTHSAREEAPQAAVNDATVAAPPPPPLPPPPRLPPAPPLPVSMAEAHGPIKSDPCGAYLEVLLPAEVACRLRPGMQSELHIEGTDHTVTATFHNLEDSHGAHDGVMDLVFVRFRLDAGDEWVNKHGAVRFPA